MDSVQQKELIGAGGGAVAGFFLGGPVGAAIGAAIGWFAGKRYAASQAAPGWRGVTTYADVHGRVWERDLSTEVAGQGGNAPAGFSDWNRGGGTADVRVSGTSFEAVGKALDAA